MKKDLGTHLPNGLGFLGWKFDRVVNNDDGAVLASSCARASRRLYRASHGAVARRSTEVTGFNLETRQSQLVATSGTNLEFLPEMQLVGD